MENQTQPPRRGRGRPRKEANTSAHNAPPVPNGGAAGLAPGSAAFTAQGGSGGTVIIETSSAGAGGGGSYRPDPRPDVRTEARAAAPRPSDPRADAEARAREILEHLGSMDEGTDEFFIPKEMVPDGWTYEWKRRLVFGKPDPAYEVSLARTGWEDVPASRHPEMMPAGETFKSIERKGMVLMQRPKQITDLVVQRDKQRARDQVRAKEAQLSGAPDGQFSRDNKGAPMAKVSKSYEAMAIPDDPK